MSGEGEAIAEFIKKPEQAIASSDIAHLGKVDLTNAEKTPDSPVEQPLPGKVDLTIAEKTPDAPPVEQSLSGKVDLKITPSDIGTADTLLLPGRTEFPNQGDPIDRSVAETDQIRDRAQGYTDADKIRAELRRLKRLAEKAYRARELKQPDADERLRQIGLLSTALQYQLTRVG